MSTEAAARALKLLLRVVGGSALLALVFVAAPERWMVAIHAALGMGQLPDAPVVGYLARSTSWFYAVIGGLFWVVSFDLVRHRPTLIYMGWATALFGVVVLVIDWLEGMPPSWTMGEAPFTLLCGAAILWLSGRIGGAADSPETRP